MASIQEQLNNLGSCCDEWKKVELITTYQITKRVQVCVPVTYQDPTTQQAAEIENKLSQINIPPDLTGEATLIKKTWNYL